MHQYFVGHFVDLIDEHLRAHLSYVEKRVIFLIDQKFNYLFDKIEFLIASKSCWIFSSYSSFSSISMEFSSMILKCKSYRMSTIKTHFQIELLRTS